MNDGSLFPATDESQGLPADFGLIAESLVPVLGPLEGPPRALAGGITNRNYRVTAGGIDYVIRVPGKDTSRLGIDRGAERAANELAAGLGIAPRVAAFIADPACIVTEFAEGTAMEEAELVATPALEGVAGTLRRLHDCGRELPSRFDSFSIVDEYALTGTSRGAVLPPEFAALRDRAALIEAMLSGPEHEPVPCHNDLLAANFIRTADGVLIVDWEYAGMGTRYFDLANLAINNGFDPRAQAALLAAYFRDSPQEPLRSLDERLDDLRRMMFMSDFREAMWGVVQGTISDLDFDFAAYAAKHFDRMLRMELGDAPN
jgi:thiamine kinase-like enzyme